MNAKKYTLLTAAGILLAVVGICLIKLSAAQWIASPVPYLCIGLGCGLFGHGTGELFSIRVRRRDPAFAKEIDVEMKDERNVALAHASKARGFDMMTYVFSALLMVYLLMGASVSVILPLVGAYLFVQFYALFQRYKLNKQI